MKCCRGTGPSILSCGKWVFSSKNSARILKRIMNNFLNQLIQKDCFSFYTVLESATRWRYIQGNISPFHSFCPLAPSISRKLKSFFGQSYSFELEQTQQIPSLESHIDQNVRPLFFYPQWNKKLHGSVFEFCLYPV